MHFLPRSSLLKFLILLLCTLLWVTQGTLLVAWAGFPTLPARIHNSIVAAATESSGSNAGVDVGKDAFHRGQAEYNSGQYEAAIASLKTAIAAFERQQQPQQAAIALSNLALSYQQLGQWRPALTAVQRSLDLLQTAQSSPSLLASILNVQASLQLNGGKIEAALTQWEQIETLYQQSDNWRGVVQSRIDQAQALRMLGFYRQARSRLLSLEQQLPERLFEQGTEQRQLHISLLQTLGDALRLSGDLDGAELRLKESLDLLQGVESPQRRDALRSRTLMSLARTERLRGQIKQAIEHYRRVITIDSNAPIATEANLAILSLSLDYPVSRNLAPFLQQLFVQVNALPQTQTGLYSRLHLAQLLLNHHQSKNIANPVITLRSYQAALSTLLEQSMELAQILGDRRSLAHAQGTLGFFYEAIGETQRAIALTQSALQQAQSLNATDISYRLNWQLGRLYHRKNNTIDAIRFYDSAIDDLDQLRSDLVAVNRDIQFSFKESVEPIYRQSVSLLTEANAQSAQSSTVQPSALDTRSNLEKARERIEALQIAELDNFFREACLDGRSVVLDQIVDQDNPTTAVVYPIVLDDRLEVIIKVPGQTDLQHYTLPKARADVEETLRSLRENLAVPSQTQAVRRDAQTLYSWLIAPFKQALNRSDVDTLVFVLDGALRNIPMGVLYDGEQYLVERYGIGVSLGLQLLEPKAITQQQLNVLAAGLAEQPEDSSFADLPFVENELQQIAATGIANQQLFNDAFTRDRLETEVRRDNFNVVHLATHGKFSSKAEDTFILAADGRILVSELDTLLRDRDRGSDDAIELLILSACETAEGDERAALGLAGVAIKAGARSTLASLWSVEDESTSILMGEFYQQLTQTNQTKAKALRQAQLALLNDPDFSAPASWAPYILVGNWL